MRLLVARCEVRYSGRLQALLPEAVRLLVFKADGSVLVTPTGRLQAPELDLAKVAAYDR
jgi:RecB family endonuclease NucS